MAAADGGNRRAGDGGGGLGNSGPGGAHRPMRAVTRVGRARRAHDISREGWATKGLDSCGEASGGDGGHSDGSIVLLRQQGCPKACATVGPFSPRACVGVGAYEATATDWEAAAVVRWQSL